MNGSRSRHHEVNIAERQNDAAGHFAVSCAASRIPDGEGKLMLMLEGRRGERTVRHRQHKYLIKPETSLTEEEPRD